MMIPDEPAVYHTMSRMALDGFPLGDVEKERQKGFRITRTERFIYRTRYFTDSGIIGSKDFVRQQYLRVRDLFQSDKEKKPKPISGLKGLYFLKRLTEG